MSKKPCGPSTLNLRQRLPLKLKIQYTKDRIRSWYEHFDGQVYISFSVNSEASRVLKHLVQTVYPDVQAIMTLGEKAHEDSTGQVKFSIEMAEGNNYVRDFYNQHGCNAFNLDKPVSRPLSFWTARDIDKYLGDIYYE